MKIALPPKRIAVYTLFSILISVSFLGCYPKRVGRTGTQRLLTWPEMTIDQRMVHMQRTILPLATELFKNWRPERFSVVNCSLCHGNGVTIKNFHMPTDYLPKLSGKLLLGPERKKHPETTKLKLNRLVPEMAEALGLKQFNLITRRGFGCYSCHLGPEGPMFGN